mgnify:FL=1|tara:strand:- start:1500 stop:1784 length:285 start_codon:yes stop_codon:yes gene_type:complete
MSYYAFFTSTYGYNTFVRIGKIYDLGSHNTVRFLLTIHRDLIDKSFWIRTFIRKIKPYLKKIILIKKLSFEDLFLYHTGLYTLNQILNDDIIFR